MSPEELERKQQELLLKRKKLDDEAMALVLEALSIMTDEARRKVFNQFCRSCCVKLERLDWADRNYCCCCSPDPRED
jgi:hypothetical protein